MLSGKNQHLLNILTKNCHVQNLSRGPNSNEPFLRDSILIIYRRRSNLNRENINTACDLSNKVVIIVTVTVTIFTQRDGAFCAPDRADTEHFRTSRTPGSPGFMSNQFPHALHLRAMDLSHCNPQRSRSASPMLQDHHRSSGGGPFSLGIENVR